MIHLVAGQSALETLQQTSVPGDKFSIDDILMEGPVPDGLRTDASWNIRADHLERYFSIPRSDYLSGKRERVGILNDSLRHDEIVLWFEFDLFCQANLLYYLDWYASYELHNTRLTLICPETVPGRERFRGLGELSAPELESLFPSRMVVTPDQKQTAQRAWQAFSSDNPGDIETFLKADSINLPLVAPALRAHLDRFPSTSNGMGVLGQKTLEILDLEDCAFHTLFPRVTGTPEIFRHGMGDLQLQAYLEMWGSAKTPLVEETDMVRITAAGRNVLQDRADAIALNGIDLWYGGVHLTPDNLWRWNRTRHKLEHAQ